MPITTPDKVFGGLCRHDALTKEKPDLRTLIFSKNKSTYYELGKVLGTGGLSVVYLATSFPGRVAVAIKTAFDAQDAKSSAVVRHEAQILAKLNHAHIVKTLEHGETYDGKPYIVMELLTGQTLDQLLLSETSLAPARAINICLQITEALDYAHSQGILHRDIKPSNIMISRLGKRDWVHVLDFGIAVSANEDDQVEACTSSGSLLYATPEQLRNRSCCRQSDIYQLALVLFEALTGRLPFDPSISAAISYRKDGAILLPDEELGKDALNPAIRDLLEASLAREPQDRPYNVNLFAGALRQALLQVSPINLHMSELWPHNAEKGQAKTA